MNPATLQRWIDEITDSLPRDHGIGPLLVSPYAFLTDLVSATNALLRRSGTQRVSLDAARRLQAELHATDAGWALVAPDGLAEQLTAAGLADLLASTLAALTLALRAALQRREVPPALAAALAPAYLAGLEVAPALRALTADPSSTDRAQAALSRLLDDPATDAAQLYALATGEPLPASLAQRSRRRLSIGATADEEEAPIQMRLAMELQALRAGPDRSEAALLLSKYDAIYLCRLGPRIAIVQDRIFPGMYDALIAQPLPARIRFVDEHLASFEDGVFIDRGRLAAL